MIGQGSVGRALLRIFTVVLILLFAQGIYLVIDGLNDKVGPADVILILGSKVKPDGSLSNRLKARLDRGYELYRQGLSRKIIVSGGIGKEVHSEAKVMAAYLKSLGVPATDLILDEKGKNTWQSALNFKQIADDHGFRSVILVSQYFHLTRAKLAFRKVGITQIYSSHARIYSELREFYSVPREVIALNYYFFRKR